MNLHYIDWTILILYGIITVLIKKDYLDVRARGLIRNFTRK